MTRAIPSLLLLTMVACCCPNPPPPRRTAPTVPLGYAPLGSASTDVGSVEFYIHSASDSAMLGFATMNEAGQLNYCPMYASTYRGMPAVTLSVYASVALDEIWVSSSWEGYEVLAHHELGSGRCTTAYGDDPLATHPMPAMLSGGSVAIKSFDPQETVLLTTLEYDPGP